MKVSLKYLLLITAIDVIVMVAFEYWKHSKFHPKHKHNED